MPRSSFLNVWSKDTLCRIQCDLFVHNIIIKLSPPAICDPKFNWLRAGKYHCMSVSYGHTRGLKL